MFKKFRKWAFGGDYKYYYYRSRVIIVTGMCILAAIWGVATDFGNDLGEQDCRPVTKVYVCNRYGCRVDLEGNERGTTTGLVAVGDRVCQRRSSGGWYLED